MTLDDEVKSANKKADNYKKVIARSLANTIKVIDYTPSYTIRSNEENRAVLEARSTAMEALFKLGFDLTMSYKIKRKA